MQQWSRLIRSGRLLALAGILCASGPWGCSRQFWREQADADVYQAVQQKLTDPRWSLPRLDITPDPRSRFYSPYDPDRPPLPPDDPAAHALMHCVDGHEGHKDWHCFGDRLMLENPRWLEPYGLSPDSTDGNGLLPADIPALREIKLLDSVELAQIHSREYQSQLEDVYLAALAVTFERFQFGVRYLGLGGSEPSIGLGAAFNPSGGTDQLSMNSRFGISQLLPAGGQVAVELANNTLWLFNPDQTSTATLLSYSLVQPLLFGAGRKVVLENLTQAERFLLYSLRDLARFRKEFFVEVVGGPQGFLTLLQRLQNIRNRQENIQRLERQVAELQAANTRPTDEFWVPLAEMPEGVQIPDDLAIQLKHDAEQGRLIWHDAMTEEQEAQLLTLTDDPGLRAALSELVESVRVVPTSLDVLQLQSELTTSRNELRDAQRQFQDALDSFKFVLGLPTDLPLGIDDSLLDQFQFIDPLLRETETDVEGFVIGWSEIDEEAPTASALLDSAQELQRLVQLVAENGIDLLASDRDKVQSALSERLARLSSELERQRVQVEFSSDSRRIANASSSLQRIRRDSERLIETLQDPALDLDTRVQVRGDLKRLQEDLLQLVRGLSVVQIGLRVQLVQVQPFEMSMEECVAYAIENRLDLMNQRALVMDARRQIEIAANRLQSALDLRVEGDVRNKGGSNPVDFQADLSQIRLGLQFTAPLDQIGERNAYRAALVNYQRAQREYMAAEDRVKQQVRTHWRSLAVLRRNIEASRQAVRIAALQLDAAVEEANAPNLNENFNTTGLGLQGRNLLQALSAVLGAENSLLSDFISYERSRLNIYRDMGMMEIGSDGIWNDKFYREELDDGSPSQALPPLSPPLCPPWFSPSGDPPDPLFGAGGDGDLRGELSLGPGLDLGLGEGTPRPFPAAAGEGEAR